MKKMMFYGFFDTLLLTLAILYFAPLNNSIVIRVGICACLAVAVLELFSANRLRPICSEAPYVFFAGELLILLVAFVISAEANLPYEEWILITGITIASDAGGLAFGKAVDGRKVEFLSKVSPNKSYAGYIGEALCSWVVGIMIILIYGVRLDVAKSIFLVSAWFVAACGDLLGSVVKRSLFIKDSDEVLKKLPIFGKIEVFARSRHGYLDCLDSLSAVLIYYFTLVIIERSLT